MNLSAISGCYPPNLITGKTATIRDDAKPSHYASVHLRMPYPPTANKYWRRVGSRTIVSRQGREYLLNALFGQDKPLRPFTAHVAVTIFVIKPDHRKRDLDNLLKPTLDALEHNGVLADDALVKRLLIEEIAVQKPGWLDVTIETLPQAPLGAGGERWHGTPAKK